MATKYAVRVFDPAGVPVRTIGMLSSARYRLAENDVGDFDVTVPWDDGSVVAMLRPPNLIEFWRDGVFAFGGYIRAQEVNQEGREAFYTVSGPSYAGWLADAVTKPATGTGDVTFGTGTSKIDDLMKAVVRAQVLDLPQKFVCAADSGLSASVGTYVATGYESVLETLQGMATRAGDTLFDIIRDTDRALRFRTWTPSRGPDKSKGTSDPILFDLRGGNIEKANWKRDASGVKNALWGGGPGDKASRYIWPPTDAVLDAASVLLWGRMEGFFDAGTESTSAVQPKTEDALKKQAQANESVSFTINEFGRYSLGDPTLPRNFDYGTKVTVVWKSQMGDPILEYTDTIQGIEVKLDDSSNVASVDINVGGTLTGDSTTRAIITLGNYLRGLNRGIGTSARH